jgi:NAD+ synthase
MVELGICLPHLDFENTTKEILDFIKETVKDANAKGVVVGLSGGVDSSLVVALCVRALGKDRVLGVLMPTSFTPQEDIDDAKDLGQRLGIKTKYVNIQEIGEAFSKSLKINKSSPKHRIPLANIWARVRMTILYYYANLNNYLVVGTGDRSETLIGYFTKYGDGGVDFCPISHLYKTQVRALAEYLGIPKKIVYKPSSPQLYPGHKAQDEIPLTYETLDLILIGLFDQELPPKQVSQLTGISLDVINEIILLHSKSEHKRTCPRAMVQEGLHIL